MSEVSFDTRTPEEARKGRRQKYVHAGWQERWATGRNMRPAQFHSPFDSTPRKRVNGGRWGVRKMAMRTREGFQWEAYTRGSLRALNRRFPNQQQAVEYAQRIAILANERSTSERQP